MGGQHGLAAAGRRGGKISISLPGLEVQKTTPEQLIPWDAQEG